MIGRQTLLHKTVNPSSEPNMDRVIPGVRDMRAGVIALCGASLVKFDVKSHIPQANPVHGVVLGFLVVCNFLKWIIFGPLSPLEVSNLKDKVSYTIWEFCFGFLIFLHGANKFKIGELQREFWKFAGLFLCVLLLKSFHYLCVFRGKVIFQRRMQSTVPSLAITSYIVRFSLGLAIINMIDIMLVYRFFRELYVNPLKSKENILMALFGFEILNTFPLIVLTTVKFGLDYYENDIINEVTDSWLDFRQNTLKISEFLANFVRFSMTCTFAICFLYFYTFPLHILPSSYLTFKVLLLKARSLINYKKSRLKVAKLISVSEVDYSHTCIICLDDFCDTSDVKLLPKCNHSFHQNCIKSWLAHSLDCPICRQPL